MVEQEEIMTALEQAEKLTVTFYLGTHIPSWMSKPETPPLFVSHRRLAKYKTLKQATNRWALDSGGFTELSMHGKWKTEPAEYIEAVERYITEIGNLDWAAPQDWMCEPWIIQKTGLSVMLHQYRTLANYLDLTSRAPHLPFIPVLQGWTLDDYIYHHDLYQTAGIDLTKHDTVGIGSVCRRQATDEIGQIVATLQGAGLKLHGFGVKGDGIRKYGWALKSADSMAWSFTGRQQRPCPERPVSSCANCYHFAIDWREKALNSSPTSIQLSFC